MLETVSQLGLLPSPARFCCSMVSSYSEAQAGGTAPIWAVPCSWKGKRKQEASVQWVLKLLRGHILHQIPAPSGSNVGSAGRSSAEGRLGVRYLVTFLRAWFSSSPGNSMSRPIF